jgi:hypothetical protein
VFQRSGGGSRKALQAACAVIYGVTTPVKPPSRIGKVQPITHILSLTWSYSDA